MAKLRINGDTSGYIDLVAPAVAGTTTLNLPTSGIAPTNAPRFTGNMGVGTTNIESGANITLGRLDVTNEGGQLSFNRSTDDTPYWNIDVYGNTSTPSLRMHNAGTTKVNIDSDGRVTMPYQPAFHAKVTSNIASVAQYADIIFGTVAYNIGSAYNSSNGRFTAPVSGLYHIYTMVRIETSPTSYWHSWFKINGTSVYTSTSYGLTGLSSVSGSSFNAGSCSFNVYLNAGDYITSSPWAGTYTINEQSYFGGYLLG